MSAVFPLSNANYLTEQEYLDGEQISDVRHEYVDGKVYAMAGSSKQHNTLALNIALELKLASRNTHCEIYASDIKVRINSRKSYYYPDVITSCEEDNHNDYYVEKPCLIVEVLSKSTQEKDYREKLLAYQTIPSLNNYLIIAQNKVHIDWFYRDKNNQGWWLKTFNNPEQIIHLACPESQLSVQSIYAGVNF